MASGSQDKTIGVWRVSSGERIKTLLGHKNPVLSVVFSPNGEYLASGSWGKTIGVWSGERIKNFKGHLSYVFSVAFSPNGEYLASGSDIIGVWRISSGECINTLTGHSSLVRSVIFSPNGEYLASGSWDNTIGVWRFFN